MYTKIPENQVPKSKKLKNLNEIKQLKTNSLLKSLNYITNKCLYFGNNFYESEATMAKNLGVSERTVYAHIKKGRELGLFRRKRRIGNSNIYSLNPELRRPEIIEDLASILPALRGLLCLSFLLPLAIVCKPSSRTLSQESCGQYKTRNYLSLKTPLKLTVETTKKGAQEDRVHEEGSRIVKNRENEESGEALQRERRYQELRQSATTFTELKHLNQSPTYVDEVKVREYKEFMAERLPRLIESVRSLALPDAKKIEILSKQIDAYRESLHFKDRERLRNEGFDI
jgi:DNA-binding transcriptional ArsR family regulator